jgi:hypothetical protein
MIAVIPHANAMRSTFCVELLTYTLADLDIRIVDMRQHSDR